MVEAGGEGVVSRSDLFVWGILIDSVLDWSCPLPAPCKTWCLDPFIGYLDMGGFCFAVARGKAKDYFFFSFFFFFFFFVCVCGCVGTCDLTNFTPSLRLSTSFRAVSRQARLFLPWFVAVLNFG